MKAILAMAMLMIVPAANGQGNKSDVIVEMDEPGHLQITPKQCYETGVFGSAVRWTICPKLFADPDAKNLYIVIILTQNTSGLFPAFTQAAVDINVDGVHLITGDINWNSQTLGRVVHVYERYVTIPMSRSYLEGLTTAQDITVYVQLTGKSTHKDMHLDGKNLQKFQSGCRALLNYLSAQQ